jgi:8-hydroxy-5-deazaflavin:NADPH oxidoreductase
VTIVLFDFDYDDSELNVDLRIGQEFHCTTEVEARKPCRTQVTKIIIMNIAIIGAGSVGQALGFGWAKRGHQVHFGLRDPSDDRAAALRSKNNRVIVVTNAQAAAASDIVAVCTPWDATKTAVESCGDLSGKVLIDCTNPLKADFSGLEIGFETSGLETVAGWAKGAEVFKAMNQIASNLMDGPAFKQGKPVMFVCGDGSRKKVVLDLVQELGFEAIDAGGSKIARLIEPYAMLWIHLALVRGLGRDFGFALLTAKGNE